MLAKKSREVNPSFGNFIKKKFVTLYLSKNKPVFVVIFVLIHADTGIDSIDATIKAYIASEERTCANCNAVV